MSENKTNLHENRISTAISFIEENLKNKLNLNLIAQEACYSKYHFSRVFLRITGDTVGDYVKKRRASESAHELLLTQKSILDIAFEYQFESQQAYTRAFKSVFEISPGKYRKKEHRLVPFEKYTLSHKDIDLLQNETLTMEPKIITIEDKKLIGQKITTSLADDKTVAMWQKFMPRRKEIKNNRNSGYYSIQVYDEKVTLENFKNTTLIEKWAAVEVSDYDHIPNEMDTYTLEGGLFAVFIHIGPINIFHDTMNYIMHTWLPNSGYELDSRDIFMNMGKKYLGPFHPKSEEEVWIPIK